MRGVFTKSDFHGVDLSKWRDLTGTKYLFYFDQTYKNETGIWPGIRPGNLVGLYVLDTAFIGVLGNPMPYDIVAVARMTDAEYWAHLPSSEVLSGRLQNHLEFLAGDVDPAHFWRTAKRRYGCKNNRLDQMMDVCGVDPEGRNRIIRIPAPAHVRKAFVEADRMVGENLGVKNITRADLHSDDW